MMDCILTRTQAFIVRLRTLIAAFLALCALVSPALSQNLSPERIVIERGDGYVFNTSNTVSVVFIADQNIAEVLADQSGDSGIFIYGKSIGQTNLSLRDANTNETTTYTVQVIHEISEAQNALSERFPGQAVVLNSARGSVMASGLVDSKRTQENILSTLKDFFPDDVLIDNIMISDSQIVYLDVRLIEVNTSKTQSFGVEWDTFLKQNSISLGFNGDRATATIGSSGAQQNKRNYLTGVIDLMEQQGVATTLSRSNLSTIPGKAAEFNVGSEIAVGAQEQQVDTDPSQRNLSVRYQFVGMNLEFVPEILPGDLINLDVNVSLSSFGAGSRVINGNDYPNINKRSFKTKVSLQNSQAFAIAGMSRSDLTSNRSSPIKTFTNNLFQTLLSNGSVSQDNTELLLIVSPIYGTPKREKTYTLLPRQKTLLEYTIEKKMGTPVEMNCYANFLF